MGFRYRAAQKMDGMAEGASNSNPHTTPEQSVAAQCQHHQQFIGEDSFADQLFHIRDLGFKGKVLSSKF